MPSDHRDDFERRVAELVRNTLEWADREYPEGYGIGRFGILYEVHVPRSEGDEDESAWTHSWFDHSGLETVFSDAGYWVQSGMLREALHQIESSRYAKRWRRLRREQDDGA